MKKFTKLFLSCAAVAAVTATVATSAMAADVTGDLAGTYTDGKLSLTTEFTGTTTVLVLAPGTDSTAVSADDILYIDQAENGAFGVDGQMGIKGAPTEETAPGTYTVMVGSYADEEFVVKTGTFRLGEAAVQYGQVTEGDTDINYEDAILILKSEVGMEELTEAQKLNANVVDIEGGVVNYEDAIDVLKYEVGLDSELAKLLAE